MREGGGAPTGTGRGFQRVGGGASANFLRMQKYLQYNTLAITTIKCITTFDPPG